MEAVVDAVMGGPSFNPFAYQLIYGFPPPYKRHNRENCDIISTISRFDAAAAESPLLRRHQTAYIGSEIWGFVMQEWLFWLCAVGLTLGVAVLLLQALRQAAITGDDESALKVYRDQLAEVDRDLARGVISAAEAEVVRTEVSRRLLQADRALQSAAPLGNKGSVLPAVGAIVLAAVAAVAVYAWIGAPGYRDLPLAERLAAAEENYNARPSQEQAEAVAPPETPNQPDAEFAGLMEKLRVALTERPDDVQGLILLARNEAQLGNFIAARKAYQHLVAVKGAKADINDHLNLAQTMIVAAGGFVSAEAEVHLAEVLKREPTNGMARYFTGLMLAQVGRPDRAFALWEPLLREGPEEAIWIAPIRAGLQDLADRGGIKYTLPDKLKGPDAEAMAAASDMTDEDRQAMIKGMVGQLQERLFDQGGSVEEWQRLITSLAVVGDMPESSAAYLKAKTAFAGNAADLAKIQEAAKQAGVEE